MPDLTPHSPATSPDSGTWLVAGIVIIFAAASIFWLLGGNVAFVAGDNGELSVEVGTEVAPDVPESAAPKTAASPTG